MVSEDFIEWCLISCQLDYKNYEVSENFFHGIEEDDDSDECLIEL